MKASVRGGAGWTRCGGGGLPPPPHPGGPAAVAADVQGGVPQLVVGRRGDLQAQRPQPAAHAGQFVGPFVGNVAQHLLQVFVADVEALDIDVLLLRQQAGRGLDRLNPALEALHDPLQDPGVLAETGPQELALGVAPEPVDVEDLREFVGSGALPEVDPVPEVVADVVSDERQHRHRVAAQHADGALGCRGGLGGAGGAHEHAVLPVPGLRHQRDGVLASAAEDDGVDGHALRVVELVRQDRALRDRGAEAGVRVRRLLARTTSLGAALGGPGSALPVREVLRGLLGLPLPPHVTVVGERDVGEDRMPALDGRHGVGVGVGARAGGHAEQSGLRVDGVEPAVLAEPHPCDVVAEGLHLPARQGGLQHRQVRLAAGRREGRAQVVGLPLRRGDLEDQHVLGQPALVATHHGGDPKRIALLAQQGVAAVARAVAPDGPLLGEVDDVLDVVAGPRDVLDPGRQGHPDGVQSGHEVRVRALHGLHDLSAHPGHDLHGDRHVGRVGDLDAELRGGGVDVSHAEGNDVHGAPHHAAVVQLGQDGLHLSGIHPVVGGAGVVLVDGADEGGVLDAGNVVGIGAGVDGSRLLVRIQSHEGAGLHEFFHETLVLLVGAVEEMDGAGIGQGRYLLHPLDDAGELRNTPRDGDGGGQTVLGEVGHVAPSSQHFSGRPDDDRGPRGGDPTAVHIRA